MRVELYNQKTGKVVESLVYSGKESELSFWLLSKGLTISQGKVMSLVTLPFGETDFILRKDGETVDEPKHSNPWLAELASQLKTYRSQKEDPPGLISAMALLLQEAMVRGAIDDCRKNGAGEADIIAALGEDAKLAEGGTRVEAVFSVR